MSSAYPACGRAKCDSQIIITNISVRLTSLEVKIDHEQWVLIHPWVSFFNKTCPHSENSREQNDCTARHNEFSESEVTCGQVWPILWICALHLTHPVHTHTQQWTHTHCEHTPEQWAAILLRWPGSSWGYGSLLDQGSTSVVVLKVEESTGYSLQNLNGLIAETV